VCFQAAPSELIAFAKQGIVKVGAENSFRDQKVEAIVNDIHDNVRPG
jgi:hypothetical protein